MADVRERSRSKPLRLIAHLFGFMDRVWNYLPVGNGHAVREVGGSNPGLDSIVGGVFHSARQPARLS